MQKLPSEKTNLEGQDADALTKIVSVDNRLSLMARDIDQSRQFWHEMECEYIFSHEQFRHLIEWSTSSVSSSVD